MSMEHKLNRVCELLEQILLRLPESPAADLHAFLLREDGPAAASQYVVGSAIGQGGPDQPKRRGRPPKAKNGS